MKKNLLGWDCVQLTTLAESLGEPSFRGKQLYRQIYFRRQTDLGQMTDLPTDFRAKLELEHAVALPRPVRRTASLDGTVKFLFELEDGKKVESVFIPEEKRNTLCISSQVGCDVGCTFCLTAQMGFSRNLRPGEIVGQVMAVIADGCLPPQGFNIVYMGMGEPLYNYRHVMQSFRLLTDSGGLNLSHRRITVSTSGVVPVLRKMHQESPLPNLAISLNATTDPVRDQIMPLNRKWNLDQLLRACREFPIEPRRRITFEYVLLKGVTDSAEDAHRLAHLVKGTRSKVNLIPYNPNSGLPFHRPSAEVVERFREILVDHHVSAFVRKTRGDDISAACGQLAHLEQVESHV